MTGMKFAQLILPNMCLDLPVASYHHGWVCPAYDSVQQTVSTQCYMSAVMCWQQDNTATSHCCTDRGFWYWPWTPCGRASSRPHQVCTLLTPCTKSCRYQATKSWNLCIAVVRSPRVVQVRNWSVHSTVGMASYLNSCIFVNRRKAVLPDGRVLPSEICSQTSPAVGIALSKWRCPDVMHHVTSPGAVSCDQQ